MLEPAHNKKLTRNVSMHFVNSLNSKYLLELFVFINTGRRGSGIIPEKGTENSYTTTPL